LIYVSNQDSAASGIHKDVDPIPDTGRSIDSSIFVMRHATFDATDFLQDSGLTLDRRHLACERHRLSWYWESYFACLLGPQCAPHDPSSKVLLPGSSREWCSRHRAGSRPAQPWGTPWPYTSVRSPALLYPGFPAESTNWREMVRPRWM